MSNIQTTSVTSEASNELNVPEMALLVHSMATNESLKRRGAVKLSGCQMRPVYKGFYPDTHPGGPPSMQRVPRPGRLSKQSAKRFILGSKGRSLLKREDAISDRGGGRERAVRAPQWRREAARGDVRPEEGELLTVHPGRQSQAGILPERRDDRGEDQSYEDKTGGKDDLKERPLILLNICLSLWNLVLTSPVPVQQSLSGFLQRDETSSLTEHGTVSESDWLPSPAGSLFPHCCLAPHR